MPYKQKSLLKFRLYKIPFKNRLYFEVVLNSQKYYAEGPRIFCIPPTPVYA